MTRMKKFQLFECLHALCNDSHFEASGHAKHRGDDGGVFISAVDLRHEGLVDLQRIDWEFPQIAQTGIAGAKIVDCHLHSAFPQRLQDESGSVDPLHENTFGELELERPWSQA